jgi:hypothetical protein
MTYTVVTRNPNSWTIKKETGTKIMDIVSTCGHKHRSEESADKCRLKLSGHRFPWHWTKVEAN